MSKGDMINAMYGAMKKMDAEKLAAAY